MQDIVVINHSKSNIDIHTLKAEDISAHMRYQQY